MKHDLAILAFSFAAMAAPAAATDQCANTFDQLYVPVRGHLEYRGCFDGTRIEFRREDICPHIATQIQWHRRLIDGSPRGVSEQILRGLHQNEKARQDYCEGRPFAMGRFFQWNIG